MSIPVLSAVARLLSAPKRPARGGRKLRVEQLEVRDQPALGPDSVFFVEAVGDRTVVKAHDPKTGQSTEVAALPQVDYNGQPRTLSVGGLVATAKGQVVVQAQGIYGGFYAPTVPGALYLVDPAKPENQRVTPLSTTQPYIAYDTSSNPPPAAALPDGRVAFVEGTEVRLYDPKAGTFSPLGPLPQVDYNGQPRTLSVGGLVATAKGQVVVQAQGIYGGFYAPTVPGALYLVDPAKPENQRVTPLSTTQPYIAYDTSSNPPPVAALPDGRVAFVDFAPARPVIRLYDPKTGQKPPAGKLPQVDYNGQPRTLSVGGLVATAKGQVVVQAQGIYGGFYAPTVPGALYLVDPAKPENQRVTPLSTTQPYIAYDASSNPPPAAALPDGRVAFVEGTEVRLYDPKAGPPSLGVSTLPEVDYNGQPRTLSVGGLVATAKGQVVVQAQGIYGGFYAPTVPGALYLVDPAKPENQRVTPLSTTQPYIAYDASSNPPPAAALGPRPDIKLLDVTADPGASGIKKLDVRVKIDGAAVGPDYKFQVFLSKNETFERGTGGDTLLAGEFVVDGSDDKKKYKQVTPENDKDGESLTITLASAAPITRENRFLIVVADGEEKVDEADEPVPPAEPGGAEIRTGKNNAMFAIPLFKGSEKGGFRKDTGTFVFGLPENDANEPIKARISRGTAAYNALVDLDVAWLGALPSPRSFKDEEPTPYAGSDHKGDAALVTPLTELRRLIDLASTDDRFAGAKAPLPVPLRLTEAFDEQGEHSSTSRHFEGRGIDIGVTGKALERVLGLGLLAGFSWVNAEGNHAHFSHTGASAVASTETLQQAVTSGGDRSLIQAPRVTILQTSLTTILNLTAEITSGISGTTGQPLTAAELQAKKNQRKAALKQFIKDVDKGLSNGQIVKKLLSATPGQGLQDAKIGDLLKFNANELMKTF